jgi:hypothetical protein
VPGENRSVEIPPDIRRELAARLPV